MKSGHCAVAPSRADAPTATVTRGAKPSFILRTFQAATAACPSVSRRRESRAGKVDVQKAFMSASATGAVGTPAWSPANCSSTVDREGCTYQRINILRTRCQCSSLTRTVQQERSPAQLTGMPGGRRCERRIKPPRRYRNGRGRGKASRPPHVGRASCTLAITART